MKIKSFSEMLDTFITAHENISDEELQNIVDSIKNEKLPIIIVQESDNTYSLLLDEYEHLGSDTNNYYCIESGFPSIIKVFGWWNCTTNPVRIK